MGSAYAMLVHTHGIKSDRLRVPYFVALWAYSVGHMPSVHLPAVVDDFGNLVIVGGPL